MDKALINELQTCFDGRGRLKAASVAIQSYTNNTSVFFSYIDGWNNKKSINIPIDPEDLLPILDRYMDNIDKEIQRIATPEVFVSIDNFSELEKYVKDYKSRFPETYTSLDEIHKTLKESYVGRKNEHPGLEKEDYHIEVCFDWKDKIYIFSYLGVVDNSIMFHFNEIMKL